MSKTEKLYTVKKVDIKQLDIITYNEPEIKIVCRKISRHIAIRRSYIKCARKNIVFRKKGRQEACP